MMSLTNDSTTALNALPIIKAIAKSITLPFKVKLLIQNHSMIAVRMKFDLHTL